MAADVRRAAREQAALRRVSRLVALGAGQAMVLDAITAGAFELFDVDFTALLRYERDGAAAIIAVHNGPPGLAVGDRAPHIPDGLVLQVFRSGRPARVEAYADVPGPEVARMHQLGVTAGAAAPILVEARLWGVIAAMTRSGTVATGLEHSLADFAEIAATAVAGAQARDDLRGLADQQAALRQIAELAALDAPANEVLEAVAFQASELAGVDFTTVLRYETDGTTEIVALWGAPEGLAVGMRAPGGDGAVQRLWKTGGAARIEDPEMTGRWLAHGFGYSTSAAVPIHVQGGLWGALVVVGRGKPLSAAIDEQLTSNVAGCNGPAALGLRGTAGSPLPVGTEERLTQFAGLAAAAIANAENKAQLTASRARVVATADETRRRLQRDVHDGAQQRLVQTLITLKLARDAAAEGRSATDLIGEALYHAERANTELRDLVQGILPASLSQGGLRAGLESIIDDIAVPVHLHVAVPRLSAETETTAYFVVAEALTNVVKHAHATHAHVTVDLDGATLSVEVRDDGTGGADPAHGSGLTGLSDRVEAADGILTITSVAGSGTTVRASLPIAGPPGWT